MANPIDESQTKGENENVLMASQPMREEQIRNAVTFLQHPEVRDSPVVYRRSFLEKKGLPKMEIDEAFRCVPDINNINDMPPDPNRPIPKPRMAPRPKPWETNNQQQEMLAAPQLQPIIGAISQPGSDHLGKVS